MLQAAKKLADEIAAKQKDAERTGGWGQVVGSMPAECGG